MLNWVLLTRIWGHIIQNVKNDVTATQPPKKRARTVPRRSLRIKVFVNEGKIVQPALRDLFPDNILTPLRAGADNLIEQDARISYSEVSRCCLYM